MWPEPVLQEHIAVPVPSSSSVAAAPFTEICRDNQPLKQPPSQYAHTVLNSVILGEEHNQHWVCDGWECSRNLNVFTFLLVCVYNVSISVSEDLPI